MTSRDIPPLEQVLIEHRALVERYVRRRLKEPDASDVLQNVWMRAFERQDQLRSPHHALGWLMGIARHAVIDEHRRLQRERARMVESSEDSSDAGSANDLCDCSLTQLGRLSSGQAAVLERVVQGETVAEAASALGISPGSASVRLFRARERMRTLMEEHCGVQSMRDCQSCGCLEAGCC